MEPYINEDAVKFFTEVTKELIVANEFDGALVVLTERFSKISKNLENSIILNKGRLKELQDKIDNNAISPTDADVTRAQIKLALLSIINKVSRELQIQQMLGKIRTGIYKTTSNENLEKILGTINHIVKINWLQKGIQVSKSVCQVVRSDGGKGTGFVLKDGYLMTNFHVLPTKEKVEKAKIVFDYEEDIFGNLKETSEFFLEADDFKFSSISKYDYAYIKIKDNPSKPLSQWGYLELDSLSDPQIDNVVTIIQHPLGETKKIALTANKIVGINGQKLLYQTDTERGSSGSPVFNNDWKVIALHHAGRTEEDGGLVIDPTTGKKRGANEGILIKNIAQDIGLI